LRSYKINPYIFLTPAIQLSFVMKAPAILALIGLLSSAVLAAPSQVFIKDDSVALHEEKFNSSAKATVGGKISEGIYYISSPIWGDNPDFLIGRGLEDRSLLPKYIKTVDRNLPYSQVQWLVRSAGDGLYILQVGRSPTAQIDQNLFAILLDDPPPTKWKIDYQPQHDAYTISSADNYQGWWASADVDSKVGVRPLIVSPSIPPYYPKSELYKFQPLDDDMVSHEENREEKHKFHVDVTVSVEEL